MRQQEPILEFRLSSDSEFSCSLCHSDGTRKKGEGSFTVVGNLRELVAAFRAHVVHYHIETLTAALPAMIPLIAHS
jgi:hypothetical protein